MLLDLVAGIKWTIRNIFEGLHRCIIRAVKVTSRIFIVLREGPC